MAETDGLKCAGYAKRLIDATTLMGQRTLFWWEERYWRYLNGVYVGMSEKKCRTEILRWLIDTKITASPDVAADVECCLKALSSINDEHQLDAWLTDEPVDRVPWLVVKNGRVNPDTGRLSEWDPRWFTCVKLPYGYDPKAVCPLWDKFLLELFHGDLTAVAQLGEYLGYCLTTDTSRHVLLWLQGAAGSGKSVVLKMAQRLLGGNLNCSQLALEEFATQFAITSTRGKLLNISDEVLGITAKVENFLKWYTGGNEIQTRGLYQNYFSMLPTARLLIASNEFPRFKDKSSGIWRRLMVLPISHECPVERRDYHLPDKLSEELPGILNWAIRGRQRLHQSGFTRCESGELFVLSQRERSASHETWAAERIEFVAVDPAQTAFVSEQTLVLDYRLWCLKAQLDATAGKNDLIEAAVRCGGVRHRRQLEGARHYGVSGIRLALSPDG